jgi:hypothetical protein
MTDDRRDPVREFAAMLREHRGLEQVLAFALVSNAADLRRDVPDVADRMLAWAEQVRAEQHSAGDGYCGGTGGSDE